MTTNDLKFILDKIANNQHTEADISALQEVLDATDNSQLTLQLAKYNVNINEGEEIHIGDRIYQQWDEQAISISNRSSYYPEW